MPRTCVHLSVVGTKALLRALARPRHLIVGTGTLLASERGRFFALDEIAGWIYDDASGGPLWAYVAIQKTIWRLRRDGAIITRRASRERCRHGRGRVYYAMARND